jgi:hypothetical protein
MKDKTARDLKFNLPKKGNLVPRSKEMVLNRLYCIPYLGSRSMQILHKDEYIFEKVQFSTFTLQNDIMFMINNKVYIFSQTSYPIMVDMELVDEERLRVRQLEIERISGSKQYQT